MKGSVWTTKKDHLQFFYFGNGFGSAVIHRCMWCLFIVSFIPSQSAKPSFYNGQSDISKFFWPQNTSQEHLYPVSGHWSFVCGKILFEQRFLFSACYQKRVRLASLMEGSDHGSPPPLGD